VDKGQQYGMTNYSDPFDPRRRPASSRSGGYGGQRMPTLDDFQQLASAYRESQIKLQELENRYQALAAQGDTLTGQLEKQAKTIRSLEQELEIKNEALHKQGEALKETESELIWERAARQKLEEAQASAEEQQWQEKFARLQADMENMRKRWEARKEQEVMGERNRILRDMLPLADHLDLALEHVGAAEETAVGQDFIKNIEATRHAFLETLRRYGVERIEAEGAAFDPNLHEAVGQEPTDDVPTDHVSRVLQAGYRDGDQVVRPARVLVSRGA
jgi:molecular chaperone GrpE